MIQKKNSSIIYIPSNFRLPARNKAVYNGG